MFSMMERLTTAQRRHLPKSAFALPDRRALPLTDGDGNLDPHHIANAAARLSMMKNDLAVTEREYERAHERIRRAACKVGMDATCLAENPLSTGQKVAIGVGAGVVVLGGILLATRSAAAAPPASGGAAPPAPPAQPPPPSSTTVPTPNLPAMPLPAPAPAPGPTTPGAPLQTDPVTDPSLVSFAQEVLVQVAGLQDASGKPLVTDAYGQNIWFAPSNVDGNPRSDVFRLALAGFQAYWNRWNGPQLRTDGTLDYVTLAYMIAALALRGVTPQTPSMPAPTSAPIVTMAQIALARVIGLSQAINPNAPIPNWDAAQVDGNPQNALFLNALDAFQTGEHIPRTHSLDWLTWAMLMPYAN